MLQHEVTLYSSQKVRSRYVGRDIRKLHKAKNVKEIMSSVGEKRKCVTCNKLVEVIELIPGENYWYTQKLSCGHTGRIWIPKPIEEKIEISEELKATPINHRFGQTHADKTTEGSRSILCKNCGHTGSKHRFHKGYAGNHNCYLCECANYEQ